MIGWRFEFGTLSDLSATIFSVFLLLLVLLADTAIGQRPAGNEVRVVERAALDAAALADLLYERRSEAAGTRIDVMPGRVTVVTPSGTLPLPPHAVNGALRAGGLPDPVRLYVFANEAYALVAAALEVHGRTWRELSVPAALRDARGGGWTDDFQMLLSRSLPKEAFVSELAVILGGGTDKNLNNRLGRGGGMDSRYDSGIIGTAGSILLLWTYMPLDAILSIIFGVTGVSVIVLVERRRRTRTP